MKEMTIGDKLWHSHWRPASGHKSGWRVCRQFIAPLTPDLGDANFQEARGSTGKLRIFKSIESAQRAADILNKKEANNES